jgi:molybdopterin-guanine dinucleotide biosynthesis protein A
MVFTLPCDTPDLPADLPERLAGAMTPEVVVVLPEVDGRLEPALGLWRVEALAALDAHLATGGRSLHGFAAAAGLARVVFGPEAAAAFANANTPEVLAQLERRL